MIIPHNLRVILKRVYGLPASITIVTGLWKTGKTDFSLLLSELCRELGIIDTVASNIETGENSGVKYVASLGLLKSWFFNDKGRKLFLYDEAIESSPRRKAMSRLNVEWIRTIPQLSKAKGHIIAITQEQSLTESAFFNPTFCRGVWVKIRKKVVRFSSPIIKNKWPEGYIISGIPRTGIFFRPYQLATFQLAERSLNMDILPLPLKASTLYSRGLSYTQIANELGLSQATQVRRLIQRACRTLVTYLQQPSEGKGLIDTCKKLDKKHEGLPIT